MPFDRYMIQVGAGAHPKLASMTVAERYAWFLGVLSLASRANPRGSLRTGGRPILPSDIAKECTVSPRSAERSLKKASELGLICRDAHGVDWVHDFDQWNSFPRSDATNAERQRRFRARQQSGRNALRNAPEVEVEVKEEQPPTPFALRNGASRSDKRRARSANPGPRSVTTAAQANKRWWLEALPEFPAAAVSHAIRALCSRGEPLSVEAVRNYLTEGGEA